MRAPFVSPSLVALLLLGCKPAPTTPPIAPPAAEQPQPQAAPVIEEAPSLRIDLRLELEPRRALHVHLRVVTTPEQLGTWTLPEPQGELIELRVEDRQGSVEHEQTRTEQGITVTLARAVDGPLALDYVLVPPASERFDRLTIGQRSLFGVGSSLFLLPNEALTIRLPITLTCDPAARADAPTLPPTRALASFADDITGEGASFEGLPIELHGMVVMAGPLEWAAFDSANGTDRVAGIGTAQFDLRWVGGEIAGVRSALDLYFGAQTSEAFVTLLAADDRLPSEGDFSAQLRGRGLLLHADLRAQWGAAARLSFTTALVQRWLGGRLRLIDERWPEDVAASMFWFEIGVARFVAADLLFEIGLLDIDDRLAELDALEYEIATNPLRGLSQAELIERMRGDDPQAATDARIMLAARGTLYALALDAALRQRHDSGVDYLLSSLVAIAVAEDRRDFPLAKLLEMIDARVPGAGVEGFAAAIDAGKRPDLRAGDLGPCMRPQAKKWRRFELGFVDLGGTDEGHAFASLDPKGPAARAGLRPDDELLYLDYRPGDPTTAVQLTLERGGEQLSLDYLPAGPPQRGTEWVRVAGIREEECRF